MQYIGELQIKKTEKDKDDLVVTFKDGQVSRIHNELADKIISKKKGNGGVTDNIRSYLAKEFLSRIAYYDLDVLLVDHVAQGMNNLMINLREQKIGEMFGCKSSLDIKVSRLFEVN